VILGDTQFAQMTFLYFMGTMSTKMLKQKKGFTLVELIIIIVILGILAAVLNQANVAGCDSSTFGPTTLAVTISGNSYTYILAPTNAFPTNHPTVIVSGQPSW
jgi:prepilin-type N-terminal cleavage/methylation domain-containing protein